MSKELKIKDMNLDEGFCVIEAGAGAGKTFNLVRIVKSISEMPSKEGDGKKRDISKVLLVTFTNAAAMEMRQRMRELLEKEGTPESLQQLSKMQISTIHAFCHRAYADFGPSAGFPLVNGEPKSGEQIALQIAEDFWRGLCGRRQNGTLQFGEIKNATKWIISGEKFTMNQGLKDSGLLKFVEDRITQMKLSGTYLTHDTVVGNLLEALEDPKRGEQLADLIRSSYEACLIDESQDTDSKQWTIFQKIFRDQDGKLLIMVGDRNQSIYGFRGANVENYKAITADARKQKDGLWCLSSNNRSSKSLIAAFNKLFRNNLTQEKDSTAFPFFGPGSEFLEIGIPNFDSGKKPRPEKKAELRDLGENTIRIVQSSEDEDVFNETARMLIELTNEIPIKTDYSESEQELANTIVKDANIGILTRESRQAQALHRLLVNRGIPAALATKSSVFTSTLAPVLHHLLCCALKPEDSSIRRALFLVQPHILGVKGDVADRITEEDGAVAAWLRDAREKWFDDGFSAAWEALLTTHHLKLTTGECPKSEIAKGPMKLRHLADLAHIYELICKKIQADKLSPEATVDYLAERIKNACGAQEDADDAECIRPESAKPQVIVRTMHTAKGLEYQGVIIPKFGMIKDVKGSRGGLLRESNQTSLISDSSDPADIERFGSQTADEDARLLYVALTRAERKITILWGNDPAPDKLDPRKNSGFPVVLARNGLKGTASCLASFFGTTLAEKTEPIAEDAFKNTLRPFHLIEGRDSSGVKTFSAKGSTSFSKLTSKHEDVEDPPNQPEEVKETKTAKEKVPLPFLTFPAGKNAGTVMHSILEEVDFTDAAKETPSPAPRITVERLLRSCGIFINKDKEKQESEISKNTELFLSELRKWMNCPLKDPSQSKLGSVTNDQRMAEVRFSLACELNASELHSLRKILAEDHADNEVLKEKVGELTKDQVDGLLIGSIDLVYHTGGKFYVIDWKSNRIGSSASSYDLDSMSKEIFKHKYHLQYTLYAAVLHQHMTNIGYPGWNYETSFGGCHYLFMRAFGCDDQGTGDFFHKPKLKTIEAVLELIKPKQQN
jgi:exodeoxyribonuclease V beta subunit